MYSYTGFLILLCCAPHIGGWSFLLKDYWEQNITERYDEPAMRALQEIEDPYFYSERLTMPKLIVNAGGESLHRVCSIHHLIVSLDLCRGRVPTTRRHPLLVV